MYIKDYARISSENVRILLKNNHVSIRRLSEIVGVSASTMTDSLKSKKGVPINYLAIIADYFNTTIAALCDPDMFADNENEKADLLSITTKYQKLSKDSQDLVKLIIDYELQRNNE